MCVGCLASSHQQRSTQSRQFYADIEYKYFMEKTTVRRHDFTPKPTGLTLAAADSILPLKESFYFCSA